MLQNEMELIQEYKTIAQSYEYLSDRILRQKQAIDYNNQSVCNRCGNHKPQCCQVIEKEHDFTSDPCYPFHGKVGCPSYQAILDGDYDKMISLLFCGHHVPFKRMFWLVLPTNNTRFLLFLKEQQVGGFNFSKYHWPNCSPVNREWLLANGYSEGKKGFGRFEIN